MCRWWREQWTKIEIFNRRVRRGCGGRRSTVSCPDFQRTERAARSNGDHRRFTSIHCFTISAVGFLRNLKITLEMIKWEHSIFALPFALCGAMLAAGGLPAWRQLGWIVVAMVSARSAAMAFNRLADASIDAANPRTATRALPVGQLTPSFVSAFVLVACGIFVLAASQLNRMTLMLSPVALGGDPSIFVQPSVLRAGRICFSDSRSGSPRRRPGSRCVGRSIREFCC